MRFYVSGGITKVPDYMERFQAAQDRLEAEGCTVINPAAINKNMPSDTTYEEYMEMCFCMLKMCSGIYLLKGWEESRGANQEYGFAKALGLPIRYEESEVIE